MRLSGSERLQATCHRCQTQGMGRLLLITLCLCGSALAGTTDPAIDDARYLEAGEQLPYVVRLFAQDAEGAIGCGTAVAVSDDWLLTAAHIVHDATEASVGRGYRSWRIRRIHVHPQFRHAMMGEHDIAVLQTDEPLELDAYPLLADGTEGIGDDAVVAGYGASGPITTGYDTVDSKCRAGTNTISRQDRSLWICHGAAGTSPRELLISPGDSGGPLLVRGRLAGIHSLVMREGVGPVRSTTGQESGHTRVGDYLEWIATVTAGELTESVVSVRGTDIQR